MKITITRAEGPAHLCGKPIAATTFAEANRALWQMSTTAPTQGYDKCDFKIVAEEAELEYDGRYDLEHFSAEAPNLQQHCVSFLRFMGGARKPDGMREDQYRAFVERQTPDAGRRQEFLTVADWLEKQP